MSKLTCEKIERELELNGQKAKFVASTLNLDYVIIDKTLYLGLDWYDIVIKDVRAKFDSDEAIAKRARQIVAANAAFEFVAAHEYGNFQITVYAKENLGYVALHKYRKLFYVQFMHRENFAQDQINKIPDMLPTKMEMCKQNIADYHEFLSRGETERYEDFVWEQDRFANERDSYTHDVVVYECDTDNFEGACLHCGEIIEYQFAVDENRITTCEYCEAAFAVSTEVIADATHNIIRIR